MQPIQPAAPIPYTQILDIFARAEREIPELSKLSLREFAQLGNYVTQSNSFAAADTGPVLKALNEASGLINYGLERSGASGVGADIGGFMGRLVGNEQLGRDIGYDLPRSAVNTLPMLAALPFAATAGATTVGLTGVAALTGMDVFEKTGDPLRAGVAGAAGAAMPFAIDKMTGGMLNNAVGQALTSRAATGIPTRFGANLVSSMVADTAADVVDIGLADERDISEVLTSDYWRTRLIANTAFAPLDAGLAIRDQARAKVSREIEHGQAARFRDEINDPVIEEPVSPIVAEEPFGGPEDLDGSVTPVPTPRVPPSFDPQDNPFAPTKPKRVEATQFMLPLDDVAPATGTLFGEPLDAGKPFEVPQLPEFSAADLPTGKAINPFDLTNRPTDSTLEWIQRVKDQKPVGVEESRSQMQAVNEVRGKLELAPVDDVVIRAETEALVREGISAEEAPARVVQKHKNEVLSRAKKTSEVEFSPETKKVVEGLDAFAEREPTAAKAMDVVKTRLALNEGDPRFRTEAASELVSWMNEFAIYDSPDAIKSIKRRMDNAKKRVNRMQEESSAPRNKGGRPSNMQKRGEELGATSPEEAKVFGIAEVMDRVEALKPELRTRVRMAYSDFIDSVIDIQAGGDVTTSAMRVIAKFLDDQEAGVKGPPLEALLKAKSSDLIRSNKQAMARRGVQSFNEDFYSDSDGSNALREDLDDYETQQGYDGDLFRINAAKDLTLFYNLPEFSTRPNGVVKLGKLQSDKNGIIPLRALENAEGWNGQKLNNAELELWKVVVPEAFGERGVDVRKLVEGLQNAEPVVEVHTYGQGRSDVVKAERDQMMHEWYDVQDSTTRKIIDEYVYGVDDDAALNLGNANVWKEDLRRSGVDMAKLDRWAELNVKIQGRPDARGPRATDYYNQISPFDVEQYPVVRVDVALPLKSFGEFEQVPFGDGILWRQDDVHENLPNTLGWAMVQFVPDPKTGETVMFVAEQQSRWGQELAKEQKNIRVKELRNGRFDAINSYGMSIRKVKSYATREEAQARVDEFKKQRTDKSGHPFLEFQHNLILKAAIAEAQKRGVKKMVISDGETAMMTQGHDTQVPNWSYRFEEDQGRHYYVDTTTGNISPRFKKLQEAKAWQASQKAEPSEPSESGGMLLHYDTTLPSAAKKLTGDKGELVDMGVHKNSKNSKVDYYESAHGEWIVDLDGKTTAYPDEASAAAYVQSQQGSPVFRNADGTPKSSITGRAYDLTNLKDSASLLIGNKGQVILSDRQHAQSMLERQGHTPKVADQLSPAVLKIASLHEKLSGQKLGFGRLIDSRGEAAGMASKSGVLNAVWLDTSPARPKNQVEFVALHEIIGHHFDEAYRLGTLDRKVTQSYEKARSHVEALPLEQRQALLSEMAGEFLTPELKTELDSVFRDTAVSFDETMANLNAMIASGLANRQSASFKWLPESIGRYARSVASYVANVYDGVRVWNKYRALKGRADIESVKSLEAFSRDLRKEFNRMEAEHNRDAKAFGQLDKTMPGGLDRFTDLGQLDISDATFDGNKAVLAAGQAMLIPKELRKKTSHFLEPAISRLNRYPSMRAVQNALAGETPLGHAINRGVLAVVFGDKTTKGGYVKVQKDGGPVGRVFNNPKISHMLDDVILDLQVEDVSLFEIKANDRPRFDQIMQQFPEKSRADVEQAVLLMEQGTRETNSFWHDTELNVAIYDFATLIREKLSGTNAEVLAHSKALVDEFRKSRITQDTRAFDMMANSLGLDNKFISSFLEPVINTISKRQQFRDSRPHWVSERRLGRYLVRYDSGGPNGTGMKSFNEIGRALDFVKQSQGKGWKTFYPGNGVRDRGGNFAKVGNKFDQFQDVMSASSERIVKPALDEMLNRGEISQATHDELVQSLADQSAAMGAEVTKLALNNVEVGRRFAEGREDLNMINQHLSWINSSSIVMPRLETDAIFRFEKLNPDIASNPEYVQLFNDAQKALQVMRTPDSKAGKIVTTATFLHFLGFSTSNMLIELTQFPVNLSPMLRFEGAKLSDSYTLPGEAAGSVMNYNVTGKYNSDTTIDGKYNFHDTLIKRANQQGLIGLGQFQEVAETGMGIRMDFDALTRGEKPQGKKWLLKPLGAFMHLATRFYGLASGLNEKVALISAAELVRKRDFGGEKNLTHAQFDELWTEAIRISKSASGGWGRSNRPAGFFDNEGAWRGVSQSMYSLGGFNSSQLSNLWTFLRVGFPKDLEGFTPTQRKQARNAAYQAFGTMIALVGVIGGIPMVGPLMRLLEDNTDLEMEKGFREFMARLGGPEHGATVADLAIHGALYAAGAPFDISSRIQPGGVLGLNAYEGWSPSALLGPAFGQAEGYVKATKSALVGDWTKATEQAMPTGFRKAYSLWANEGDYVSQSGEVRLKPTEAEKVSLSLGLSPRRMTQLQERERIERTAARVRSERNKRVINEAELLYKTEGPSAAQRYLAAHASDELGFDTRAATRQVAQQMFNRENGVDPRRIGSVQGAVEARNVAGTFDFSGFKPISETDRVMTEMLYQMQMGVSPRDAMRSLKQASMVEMLQQNSNLPYAAIQRVAAGLGGGLEQRQSALEFLPFL